MTMLSNVSNLGPGANVEQPLAPAKWQQSASRWESIGAYSAHNGGAYQTAPVGASPSIPAPGQPAYGLQASPNYGPAPFGSFGDGAPAALAQWSASGGWSYVAMVDGTVIVTLPKEHAGLTLRPGVKGYAAVVEEWAKLNKDPRITGKIVQFVMAARQTPEASAATAPTVTQQQVAEEAAALVPLPAPSLWDRIRAWFGFGPAAVQGKLPPAVKVVGGASLIIAAIGAGVYWYATRKKD